MGNTHDGAGMRRKFLPPQVMEMGILNTRLLNGVGTRVSAIVPTGTRYKTTILPLYFKALLSFAHYTVAALANPPLLPQPQLRLIRTICVYLI